MNYEEKGSEPKVGYGRPPEHTQFKPGQSGNPKGRPKGSKNVKTIVKGIFMEAVEISRDGKRIRVPAFEAILLRLRNKAFEGDPRSIREMVDLAVKHLPDEEDAPSEGGMSAEEAKIIEEFKARNPKPRGGKSDD